MQNPCRNLWRTWAAVAGVLIAVSIRPAVLGEVVLSVSNMQSSPEGAIRQGDAATFSVIVSVDKDLPAGEYIVDEYFEIYWSINKASDYTCVYSVGPTTATSITYTFDEADSYIISCSVHYFYKLNGDEDFTELFSESEGYKDVVKVTAISLRASGEAKTIGDVWVKDDWEITTFPEGYRDLVDLPDHTISIGRHTVVATCGTSHAEFPYVGIQISKSWTATIGPDFSPDDVTYTVKIEGADGEFTIDYFSEDSEGGIAGGVASGVLQDGVPYTDTVQVALVDELFGGGQSYAVNFSSGDTEQVSLPLYSEKVFGGAPARVPVFPADEGVLSGIMKSINANIIETVTGVVKKVFKFVGDNLTGECAAPYPDPPATGYNPNAWKDPVKTKTVQVIAARNPDPSVIQSGESLVAELSLEATGHVFSNFFGLLSYARKIAGTATLSWVTSSYGTAADGGTLSPPHYGRAAVTITLSGTKNGIMTRRNPDAGGYVSAQSASSLSASISYLDLAGISKEDRGAEISAQGELVAAEGDGDLYSVSYPGGNNPTVKVLY